MRTKAIDALGYYNDDTTISFLKHVTALDPNEATPKLKRATRSMKHHAIMALAKTLSEGAVEALEASLKDPDIQIRMTAISALGKHCGKPGKSRLQQLGKVEENPYVRRELRKYVKL